MQYFLYNLFWSIALLVALPLLPLWIVLGERFRSGFGQRLGFYRRAVQQGLAGRPIWIHSASVGEVNAAARLGAALKDRLPDRAILLSTFTATGHRMAQRLPCADGVIFLPFDHAWIVRRALARFNPCVLIILETEIWPNLLREAYRRGIPTLLLSGRLSPRAYRRYVRFGSFFRRVMRYWTAAGVQTAADAERIVQLGAAPDRVSVIGNLKRAPARGGPPAAEPGPQEANGSQGPLLVAGSSHRGEEEILANVFLMLKRCFPTLRMVLAPRHPERFSEVERLLSAHGIVFDKRSALGRDAVFTRDVMVLDTLGELERFYAIGDLAFVGGSLVDVGGHNLLEPARYGKPVLFGPFMANFRSLADEMKRGGGAIEVRNAEELAGSIADLLRDPAKRNAIGAKAFGVAAEDPDVLQRSLALAERYLQP